MYNLAEVLHKTVAEISEITADEFAGWIAYFAKKETNRGERE
jgi:hypothetical protein